MTRAIPQPWRKPGSARWPTAGAKGLLPTFHEEKFNQGLLTQEGSLGPFFSLGFRGEKRLPDHTSKILGASTAFLRAVPPQRQQCQTLKAIKYLGYFRIIPWPPGTSY